MEGDYFKPVFDRVIEFGKFADESTGHRKPQIISKSEADLAVGLIEEELEELKKAISEGDLIEVADAFGDLQYVLSGAIVRFGLHTCFRDLFEEIHRNNMERFPEAERVEEYENRLLERYPAEDFKLREKHGRVFAERLSDGKILKPNGLRPNLRPIVRMGEEGITGEDILDTLYDSPMPSGIGNPRGSETGDYE